MGGSQLIFEFLAGGFAAPAADAARSVVPVAPISCSACRLVTLFMVQIPPFRGLIGSFSSQVLRPFQESDAGSRLTRPVPRPKGGRNNGEVAAVVTFFARLVANLPSPVAAASGIHPY